MFLIIRHGVSMIVRHPIIAIIALYKGHAHCNRIQIWFFNEIFIQVIGAITILSIIFVSEARKYSVISTKVERVNLDSSVRRRPGIE